LSPRRGTRVAVLPVADAELATFSWHQGVRSIAPPSVRRSNALVRDRKFARAYVDERESAYALMTSPPISLQTV
jgi:hypothetical protein